jgi:hypothetical protein
MYIFIYLATLFKVFAIPLNAKIKIILLFNCLKPLSVITILRAERNVLVV